jgi:hypothetical protein
VLKLCGAPTNEQTTFEMPMKRHEKVHAQVTERFSIRSVMLARRSTLQVNMFDNSCTNKHTNNLCKIKRNQTCPQKNVGRFWNYIFTPAIQPPLWVAAICFTDIPRTERIKASVATFRVPSNPLKGSQYAKPKSLEFMTCFFK